MTDPLEEAFTAVSAEMERQDTKFGDQSHLPDGTGTEADKQELGMWRCLNHDSVEFGTLTWRLVLLEEVYEVLSENVPDRMIQELIQTAAVCMQWALALKKRIP